jgi:hypothetical protein
VLNVSSEAAKISAKGVCKVYDTARGKITAVEDFSLDVADGVRMRQVYISAYGGRA